ncbi:PAC2 family protein [Halobaculum sp. CBA1158]|uniref:proteasome assembly chaperone family protein n=1 Tax=Halobaculum sp. CBA1158 TaxID=2904243 RepID=UPI001F192F6B|nr:PAC2 family protein [Halobaculum sp. CBA1158]UIO98947.1 PAC2 family protein [Halobaculum sp. CBA1158]
MGHIDVVSEREFDDPVLVEGFPGVGLVGKIVADHLVETLEMDLYATVHCDGLPAAAAYAAGDRAVTTPVRLYADRDSDLLVLQSDVPVSPDAAEEFAGCIEGWFREASVTPLYIAGLRGDGESEGPPTLRGVAVGGADDVLDGLDVPVPEAAGFVSGPTGALLAHALEADLPAVGLVVDADPQFPDPSAAQVVLESVVGPLAAVDVDVGTLETHAERIQRAKEQLAAQMQQGEENVSQAQSIRMYQ